MLGFEKTLRQRVHLYWSLALCGLWGLSLAAAIRWHPTPLTWVILAAGLPVAVLNLVAAIRRLVRASAAPALAYRAAALAVPGAFVFPAVRASMPWEDPATGMGSPLAALLSLICATIGSAVIVALPALVTAAQLYDRRKQTPRA